MELGPQLRAAPAAYSWGVSIAPVEQEVTESSGDLAPDVPWITQVWDKPLYTLSGASIISDSMRVCGAQNIFAAMKVVAPVVTPEGVLQEDPEVIFGTSEKSDPRSEGGLAMWRAFPSITLVWNDPVNLMSYVTYVFQSYFGYSREKAEKLMMDVHTKGRAVVSTGPREKMEIDTEALQGFGLWATFQKDH